MTETFTSLKIESMDEFQGGAIILPNDVHGYVMYFRDRNGNLKAPIYVTDQAYSDICSAVAVNKEDITLMLAPALSSRLPEKGFYGLVLPKE